MPPAEIIDAHLHLIYRNRQSYPWLAGVVALDRDARYERYAEEALRCGVTGALHLEVDVAEPDIKAETPLRSLSARPLGRLPQAFDAPPVRLERLGTRPARPRIWASDAVGFPWNRLDSLVRIERFQ